MSKGKLAELKTRVGFKERFTWAWKRLGWRDYVQEVFATVLAAVLAVWLAPDVGILVGAGGGLVVGLILLVARLIGLTLERARPRF